mmetsp:Transcript_12290/g.33752  ORF Transcript_12290/g.33752 Transcript_12290/m.33752 type:complete len:248 (+) Transcript_12290:972-1715(+)
MFAVRGGTRAENPKWLIEVVYCRWRMVPCGPVGTATSAKKLESSQQTLKASVHLCASVSRRHSRNHRDRLATRRRYTAFAVSRRQCHCGNQPRENPWNRCFQRCPTWKRPAALPPGGPVEILRQKLPAGAPAPPLHPHPHTQDPPDGHQDPSDSVVAVPVAAERMAEARTADMRVAQTGVLSTAVAIGASGVVVVRAADTMLPADSPATLEAGNEAGAGKSGAMDSQTRAHCAYASGRRWRPSARTS